MAPLTASAWETASPGCWPWALLVWSREAQVTAGVPLPALATSQTRSLPFSEALTSCLRRLCHRMALMGDLWSESTWRQSWCARDHRLPAGGREGGRGARR